MLGYHHCIQMFVCWKWENVSKFIDEDLSSIQKIITESLKDNRSLEVKAVNEMMKIQLESLLESIRKTKQSTCSGSNEPVGDPYSNLNYVFPCFICDICNFCFAIFF
jgi:hypothetical protein